MPRPVNLQGSDDRDSFCHIVLPCWGVDEKPQASLKKLEGKTTGSGADAAARRSWKRRAMETGDGVWAGPQPSISCRVSRHRARILRVADKASIFYDHSHLGEVRSSEGRD